MIDETRTTVLVEIRRHGDKNTLDIVLGRIPVVGEYIAWDAYLLFRVTHVIHSHHAVAKKRPGSHMPDGSRFDNDGRISAVVYAEEIEEIPGLEFRDNSELEPS